ncbi:MAG: tRNA pseudouridine(38-40) synthase TruA [Rhodospirillales bacterium]|nr:tRNA pseudouridine(38-40) synthase TruA [Rhodospirillales bacterium]
MTRFKLTIEYDGGPFVGWQRQENGLGVQQVMEQAIAAFSGETVTLHGAGRTDTGVHALGQVAHIDLAGDHAADTVQNAINFHMKPAPVAVLSAEVVPPDFEARFDAKERAYLYRITNRRSPLALDKGRSWRVPQALDAGAMHEAAQGLIGRHDFSTFRAATCQAKSPLKTLDQLAVSRDGETISITARARSFMHHQVRNMVGTLKLVGEGKWTAADVKTALEACDRTKGGPTAPPDGLYLVEVVY